MNWRLSEIKFGEKGPSDFYFQGRGPSNGHVFANICQGVLTRLSGFEGLEEEAAKTSLEELFRLYRKVGVHAGNCPTTL